MSVSNANTIRANIFFAEKDRALREDVHRLGTLVGELVREQGGEALFDLVETARRLSIAHREGDRDAYGELKALIGALAPSTARDFIRAFSTYFQMVNTAEKVHRIRRRRAYLRDATVPQPFGFIDICQKLKAQGVDAEELERALATIRIQPVFTAHPTEVTRRTLLRKEHSIAGYLVDMMDPYLTPNELEAMLGKVRQEMTTGWQTAEHAEEGVRLRDEAEHVLFFLTDVLYRMVPPFYENLESALAGEFAERGTRIRVPIVAQFGTWVGGDMDGNPHVTAKSIRQTLARQRSLVIELYHRECMALAGQLSQSADRVRVSEELERRTRLYAGHFPETAASLPIRHRQMPYRAYLRLVGARLRATYDDAAFPYESPEEFVADIELVADSLRAHKGRNAGLWGVRRLLRRARTFGFHMAMIDIRQNALVHRRVIGAALQEPNWLALDDDERARRLEDALERRESPLGDLSSEGRRTLAVFQTIAHCRRKYGRDSVGPYIVSMAHGIDDVLSVLLLAKWGHLGQKGHAAPLDIAPLFETGEDVERAPKIMDKLLGDTVYREHLRSRSEHQIVMLGYSDSHRDGGIAAARWSVQKAEQALLDVTRRHGVALTIFHGRGSTVSRSGGALHEAILAAPRGAIDGRLRMTEQGENINTKYGLRGIAIRTLEQTLSAVLLVTLRPPPANPAEPRWQGIMEGIASASRSAYQSLLSDPNDFMEYFRAATPFDVIERIASKSERAEHVGDEDSAQRAAPWTFAWTQSRCLLPSWYGVASGLKGAIEEHGEDVLVEMFEQWHFFRVLLSDVATALAKADLDIAAQYSMLAGERHEKFFPAIRTEYRNCVDMILRLTRQKELLEASRTLRRAIRLRNPYVDPISFLQVGLLERWRAGGRQDDATFRALAASINGIAHAMQSAG
ncbi:MAG TPA: phosphoenolpyruvate carboxylase [Gammaproteobacteria bacterium]|nr:phosphoenolpyruvate carboxylase [Gammaproteobacteria bacterium]